MLLCARDKGKGRALRAASLSDAYGTQWLSRFMRECWSSDASYASCSILPRLHVLAAMRQYSLHTSRRPHLLS
jgi:hypothetical protein